MKATSFATVIGLIAVAVALLAALDLGSSLLLPAPGAPATAGPAAASVPTAATSLPAETIQPASPQAARPPQPVGAAPTPTAPVATTPGTEGVVIQLRSGLTESGLRSFIARTRSLLCMVKLADDNAVVAFVPPGTDRLPADREDGGAWSAFQAAHSATDWIWIPCDHDPGFKSFLERWPGYRPCLLLDPDQAQFVHRQRKSLLAQRPDATQPEPATLVELSPDGQLHVRIYGD